MVVDAEEKPNETGTCQTVLYAAALGRLPTAAEASQSSRLRNK